MSENEARKRWHQAQARQWGEKIAAAREALGWTQLELAMQLRERGVHVTPGAIGLWEQGRSMPTDWMRLHVARALHSHEAKLFMYTVALPEVAA